MEYTPKRLAEEHRKMADTPDWYLYPESRAIINQPFADRKAWDEMERFYLEAIRLTAGQKMCDRILAVNHSQFQVGIEQQLPGVFASAEKKDYIKAIYFEYDQGDAGFFLCSRFDKEDEDWASTFLDADVLDSPNIAFAEKYQGWDIEDSATDELVARYFDGKVLSILGRALDKISNPRLPFAAAQHDRPIIYL